MKAKYLVLFIFLVISSCGAYFYFTPFQPIDKPITIDKIIVLKSERSLQILSNDSIIKTYKISLGRNPKGHKQFEGDEKTPEGLYTIHAKSDKSGYHKNLGISYPNAKDIAFAKSMGKKAGGLIKIHGLKNGFGWIGRFHLLTDWTLGCIAITDEEVDELYEIVKIGTPIEILP